VHICLWSAHIENTVHKKIKLNYANLIVFDNYFQKVIQVITNDKSRYRQDHVVGVTIDNLKVSES
jgi:hypothetical protein